MMDHDKGRKVDVPKEFASYRKDSTCDHFSRKPTSTSTDARNRLLYQSNFTIA